MSKKYLISTINESSYLWTNRASLEKKSVYVVYLLNKPSSSPTLDLIINQVKFKHNNVLINIMTQINYV